MSLALALPVFLLDAPPPRRALEREPLGKEPFRLIDGWALVEHTCCGRQTCATSLRDPEGMDMAVAIATAPSTSCVANDGRTDFPAERNWQSASQVGFPDPLPVNKGLSTEDLVREAAAAA